MKINLNFSNKLTYLLIASLAVLLVVGAGYAYTQAIPNPGHGAIDVWVTVPGVAGERTLQQAINENIIYNCPGGISAWSGSIRCKNLAYATGPSLWGVDVATAAQCEALASQWDQPIGGACGVCPGGRVASFTYGSCVFACWIQYRAECGKYVLK